MSRIISGSLGVIAATLAFSAVQLEIASGNDALGPRLRNEPASAAGAVNSDGSINRSGKGDRGFVVTKAIDSVTLSFKLPDATDSSIAMRLESDGKPVPLAAQRLPSDNEKADNSKRPRKTGFACEAVASPLSANAKLLQPGRCVT